MTEATDAEQTIRVAAAATAMLELVGTTGMTETPNLQSDSSSLKDTTTTSKSGFPSPQMFDELVHLMDVAATGRDAPAGTTLHSTNNGTPISSPLRLARSPLKTPQSFVRPKKTTRFPANDDISRDIPSFNPNIMKRNADLGHNGNIDGCESLDLPSNLDDLFEFGNFDISSGGDVDTTSNEHPNEADPSSFPLMYTSSQDHGPPPPPLLEIPDVVKERFKDKNFMFTRSIHIRKSESTKAGYKSPFNPVERNAVSTLHQFNRYVIKNSHYNKDKKSNEKKTRGFNGPKNKGVELLVDYVCVTANCPCKMKIARFDNNNDESHILCYELLNPTTGIPFEHYGHDTPKEEQKKFRNPNKVGKNATQSNKPKYDEIGLTDAQKTYIAKFGAGHVSTNCWNALARRMIRDQSIITHPAQEAHVNTFADRIKAYVTREKRGTDTFFVNEWGKQKMSGNDCKAITHRSLASPKSIRITA